MEKRKHLDKGEVEDASPAKKQKTSDVVEPDTIENKTDEKHLDEGEVEDASPAKNQKISDIVEPEVTENKTDEKLLQKEETSTDSKCSRERKANIKICSFNVAGLKAWVKKSGMDYIKEEDADIVCLQETKCLEKDLPGEVTKLKKGGKLTKDNNSDYYMYWCNGEKKGYSGVCLWSKKKPLKVTNGIGMKEHDNEGRLITAEYEKFFLVTTYVPNSGRGLVRLDYRRTWNTAIKDYLDKLRNAKPVIFCGDLNVAHQEIDIANPKSNKRNAGFTEEERGDFTTLLDDGYIDSYRHLNPETKEAYTYWTYMSNARARNVGWRLDYFVLSKSLEENLCSSEIRPKVLGSDHCPVILTLDV